MSALRLPLLSLLSFALACGPADPVAPSPELGSQQRALGEPSGTYPNRGERVFHYLTNRARLEPTDDTVCGQGFDVPVTGPLEWNLKLNQVARFHSREMAKAPCFQHASCSFILGTGPSACSSATPGEAGGACSAANETYCAGWDPVRQVCNASCPEDPRLDTFWRFTEVFGYDGHTMGENIAAGQSDEREAFCAFFLEGPENHDGLEHGHFENIVNGAFNEVGHGVEAIGHAECQNYLRYYSQDFGGRNLTAATLPSAVMWSMNRQSPPVFGAIWNDANPPAALHAVVAGVCHPLALATGVPNRGAYEASLTLQPGCHSYYFTGQTQGGRLVEYPTGGSLVAPVGTTCPADYVATREVGSCSTCTPGLPCSEGECRTGLLDCSGGSPACATMTNRPDGTPCSGGETCQGGACGGCKPGTDCFASDGCRRGRVDCSSGLPVCAGLVDVADETPCGAEAQCYAGACGPCLPGADCVADGGCKQGTRTCADGQPVCEALSNSADGTPCGEGAVCFEGACVGCPAGDACPDPGGDPCKAGVTDCSSGQPACVEPRVVADGTGCGIDRVCSAGACVVCKADLACQDGDNPCREGRTNCETGAAVCVGLHAVAFGTRCGSGMICDPGECVACVEGAACSPSDPCRVGTLHCTAGGGNCSGLAALPDGAACPGGLCLGGGCMHAVDAGTPEDAGGVEDAGAPAPSPVDEGGCGCATSGWVPGGWWALLALPTLRRRGRGGEALG